jgi:hypothetical protein
MRALVLVLLAGGFALASPARAAERTAEDRAAFEQGVQAYEQGRHAEAAAAFRGLLERGHHDPDVLFNFGDAAYRQGRPAVAAWAFEWARRLDPTDEEVRDNLEMARAQLVVDELPSGLNPAAAAALDALRLVPLALLAVAFGVCWLAGWLLAAWRVLRGATWATGAAFGLLLLAGVLALPLWVRAGQVAGPPEGLIVRPEVTVRSGPGDGYAALFELHAGTLLQELENRQGWMRVRVPHGPGGWVPDDTLAVFGRPETLP